MPPDAPVVTYRLHTSTIVFYSHRLCLEVEDPRPEAALKLLRTRPGSWLLTRAPFLADLPRRDLELLAQRRQYVLARLRPAR
jgi:hypothetical protein